MKVLEKKDFGRKLRQLRRKKQLNQGQVARAIGVSTPTVSRWEKALNLPDEEYVERLARFYEVSEDFFLVEESLSDPKQRAAIESKIASEVDDFLKDQTKSSSPMSQIELIMAFATEKVKLELEIKRLRERLLSLESKAATPTDSRLEKVREILEHPLGEKLLQNLFQQYDEAVKTLAKGASKKKGA